MPSRPTPTWNRSLRGWLGRVRGPNLREWQTVREVRQWAEQLRTASPAALVARLGELRDRAESGACCLADDILAPSFALICEAVRRTLAMTIYDVQLLAGRVLAERNIAEMQTGEGKTLVVLFPAVLHALSGRGVHIMTVNDYLAARRREPRARVRVPGTDRGTDMFGFHSGREVVRLCLRRHLRARFPIRIRLPPRPNAAGATRSSAPWNAAGQAVAGH